MSMSIPKTEEEQEVYDKLYEQYNKLTNEDGTLNKLSVASYS